MRPDDDHPVEFLVSGPDRGADEELAQPEGFPRLRRARLPLLAAGAVGLVVVIVIAALNGPSGSPSADPAPTVTVGASPSSSPRPSSPALPLQTVHCPAGASCSVLLSTPPPLRAAVRDALPRATQLLAATTITHRDAPGSQLLARAVTGRVGTARLRIRVVPDTAHVRPTWNASEDAARTQVTATDRVHGYLVTVRVTAAPGYDIAIPAVRHLAADPRLTVLT